MYNGLCSGDWNVYDPCSLVAECHQLGNGPVIIKILMHFPKFPLTDQAYVKQPGWSNDVVGWPLKFRGVWGSEVWGVNFLLMRANRPPETIFSNAGDPLGSRQAYDSFTTSSRHVHDKFTTKNRSRCMDQLQFCLRHVHDLFTTRSRLVHDRFLLKTRSYFFGGSSFATRSRQAHDSCRKLVGNPVDHPH
jgi:hypothetical protein